MNLHQGQIHVANIKLTAGSTFAVPPAFCPPPADVKRTGVAISNRSQRMGTVRPVVENMEAAP
jgi:hypothetical protein